RDRRKKIQKAIDLLDDVLVDEQEAYDNMPENLQDSDKGDTMQTGIDNLQDGKDLLEEVLA
ncbi:hypothetical protein LCGC14_2108750, partial [marine sediment metagenome]